jgi:hypothetical protein
MPTAFRHGAILLTLIGTAALTTAHQIGSNPDRRASLRQMLSVDALVSTIGSS